MNRPLTTLFLAIVMTAACGETPEPIAEITSPLFVVASEAGYGPFAVVGNVPSWGDIDIFSDTASQRLRGDINTGSGHVGRIVVPTIGGVSWALKSPQYSYVIACAHMPTRNDYVNCQGQNPAPVGVTAGGGSLPWVPAAFIVGYAPPCPTGQTMTTVHQCTGTYTPYDGSGIATAVVADGFVSAGLPYGNPLKLTPGANPDGTQVECVVDLNALGLGSKFTAPPGYTLGKTVMAVYACP